MSFPLSKYKFYQHGNRIIAVSTYGGRTVRGVAVCHPQDNFNLETGKALAAARCNAKIATKRYMRAQKRFAEAVHDQVQATKHAEEMSDYLCDSRNAVINAQKELDNLVKDIASKVD